jgi:aminoglycoside phosphotransferase (APT) family kinase protein
VKLPDHTPVPPEAAGAIAERHGRPADRVVPLPTTGIINAVYLLGDDLVLRVPRNHPAHVAQARREAGAIPIARAAGVRTPALVAFDDSLELLPVPYLVVERVHGQPLELMRPELTDASDAWREVGRDLARLHVGAPSDPAPTADDADRPDPRSLVEPRVSEGWLSPRDGIWLRGWLERRADRVGRPAPPRLTHADVQAANVLVGPAADYRALIDWGGAHWDDPAVDFLAMPLAAAAVALAGHREVAPVDGDETAEARIVWLHVWLALDLMPRGAAPGCSWGERPLAMLMDIMRFFLEAPAEPWRSLAPERPRGAAGSAVRSRSAPADD